MKTAFLSDGLAAVRETIASVNGMLRVVGVAAAMIVPQFGYGQPNAHKTDTIPGKSASQSITKYTPRSAAMNPIVPYSYRPTENDSLRIPRFFSFEQSWISAPFRSNAEKPQGGKTNYISSNQ